MGGISLSRRKVREVLLQLIFQMDFHREHFEESAFSFLEEQPLSDVDRSFAESYLRTLLENRERIDEKIIKNLKGWTLNRLSKIDLTILRLGTYEILLEDDIPKQVSINEALEMAKKYSEDKSRKFINGVLDAIAKEQG